MSVIRHNTGLHPQVNTIKPIPKISQVAGEEQPSEINNKVIFGASFLRLGLILILMGTVENQRHTAAELREG